MSDETYISQNEKIQKLLNAYESGHLCTDSRVEDFCVEMNIDLRDGFNAIAQRRVQGTRCEGCLNAPFFGSGMFPCISCVRQPSLKDYYNS